MRLLACDRRRTPRRAPQVTPTSHAQQQPPHPRHPTAQAHDVPNECNQTLRTQATHKGRLQYNSGATPRASQTQLLLREKSNPSRHPNKYPPTPPAALRCRHLRSSRNYYCTRSPYTGECNTLNYTLSLTASLMAVRANPLPRRGQLGKQPQAS